jgi:hypothetical protein
MTDPKNAPPGGALAAALGAVVLILAVVTVWQSGDNRGLQQTMADNQPRLAKTQTIASLDNNLIQLLAKSAVDDKDDALRELLRANGVTLKQSAAPQQQVVGNAQ